MVSLRVAMAVMVHDINGIRTVAVTEVYSETLQNYIYSAVSKVIF